MGTNGPFTSMVVDLVDPKLDRIVWRGVVTKAVPKTMKPNSKKIDAAIRSVLRRLPR